MGITSIILVTILYLITAYSFWGKSNYAMTIAFVGYAFANIGFMLEALKK